MEHSRSTPLFCTANGYEILYAVRRGDTLTGIVQQQYNLFGSKTEPVLRRIMEINPEISSPDVIYAGQLIVLRFPWDAPEIRNSESSELWSTKETWNKQNRTEQEQMADLAYVYNLLSGAQSVASGGMTAAEHLIKSNIEPIKEIAENYNRYKAGELTKGQYDYARREAIQRLQKRFGRPAESLLFRGQKANVALRMKPGGGVNATRPFLGQVNHLSKISGLASKGGYVLAGVGLGIACHQIANTPDVIEKDKIAVETFAGTAAGIGTGVALGLFLVSGPLGWGAALLIGVGSAATGYYAGKFAGHVYDSKFSNVRIVEPLMIDRVCR